MRAPAADVRPALPAAPAVPVTEEELRAFGRTLGAALVAPVVVALHGDLGAGKTTFAQAVVAGCGGAAEVTSPTYALVHQYAAVPAPVYHLDLYRLNGPGELTNLGWDDIVQSGAIVLIEWPARAGARLPRPRLDVTLREVPGDEQRRSVEVRWTD